MTRLLRAALVMAGISVLVFLIFFATPGADPAARLAGRGASAEALAAVRQEYGLDRPLPVQYVRLMRLLLTGELTSQANRGQKVVPAVLRAAPVTLSLAAGAAAIWLAAGLGIGLVAAAREGGGADRVLTAVSLVGISIPVFWLGEVVALLSQDRLHDTWLFRWVPPPGYVPLSRDPLGWAASLVLPWLTLAVLYAGIYGRVLRSSLIEAYRQDYVRTARAKGLGETRVLLRHALRNALGPVLALFGLDLGALVGGGTVLTEIVFGLPGVGRLLYDALLALDLPMVMAAVLYASCFVVLASAAVDAGRAGLDPRQR